ncbi:MAG: hypothetical protein IKQ92_09650 [Clostridia bacterium]|nr:hypothetical protein [Clostridia bacterium]
MKKLLILALALLLFLPSCGSKKPAMPFAADSSEFWYDGRLFYRNDWGRLAYRGVGGDEMILCFDPLCTHTEEEGCPAVGIVLGHPHLAVTADETGSPSVFIADMYRDKNSEELMPEIKRLDLADGKMTVLLAPAPGQIWGFWLYGQSIYFTTSADEEKLAGTVVWKMDADGTGLKELARYEDRDSLSVVAIFEEEGKTMVIWGDSNDAQSLYLSPEDFSEETKIAEGVPLFQNFMLDGYLYFARRTERVFPALLIDGYAQDTRSVRDENGMVRARGEMPEWEYVRIPLADPFAEPEAVVGGIKEPNSIWKPLCISGNTAYVIPYDPLYLETMTADMTGVITGDDVQDSFGGEKTEFSYIVADSGGKILAFDLETGGTRTLETPGFDANRIIGMDDGALILAGTVTDPDRIREDLDAHGVHSSDFTFGDYLFLPVE